MKIEAIKVGRRHRADLGGIDSLAQSIRRNGLLHPVVVTKDKELIAGVRRIEAVKRLGWTDVPVTVVNISKDCSRPGVIAGYWNPKGRRRCR